MEQGNGWETFEHTADLGLYIYGNDLSELMANACEALCAQFVDNPEAVRPAGSRELVVEDDGEAELLRTWLAELLYVYDSDGWLPRRADIRGVDSARLSAVVWGEPADENRHELKAEIKAVTWHRLAVDRMEDGKLRGTVIFDI